MPLFRSKPKVVEANQYFPGKDVPGVFMYTPDDVVLHSRISDVPLGRFPQDPYPAVRTMQGEVVRIKPGEWVIKEKSGDGFYPCDPDEFIKLYDPEPIDPEGTAPRTPSTSPAAAPRAAPRCRSGSTG